MNGMDICMEAAGALSAEDIDHLLSMLGNQEISEPTAPALESEREPDATDTADNEPKRRRSVKHEWPEIGTQLQAHYFGTEYTATVIKAGKRLKSGKQVRIDSGFAEGTICDSLSDAMLQATAEQRERENLNRKGVANGWDFWQWDGKDKGEPYV